MISVPAIAGAPLWATAQSASQQVMPDGSVVVRRVVSVVARDSRGRTYGELRMRAPMTQAGMGQLVGVCIYDPHTGIRTLYYPGAHTAIQQIVPERGTPAKAPDALVKVQDLGSKTIDDFAVKGTRRTVVVPAMMTGTGSAITVVDEYWYSEELRVNLLQVHSDPRTGTLTMGLSDIKREDPDPTFFKLPPGYHTTDLIGYAPSTGGGVGNGGPPYSIPFSVPGADIPGDISGAW